MKKFGFSFALVVLLSGCLQTREAQKEKEEKQVLKKQLTSLQQNTADINARFQDIDDEIRRANGRIEAVEARMQQQAASQATAAATAKNEKGVLETKMRERDDAYREELVKLQGEIAQLREQIAALRESQKQAAAPAPRKGGDAANAFPLAEELFEKKSWKEAILNYEKYRSQSPKGKSFATATYKIGVCFQELGMNDEAAAFYEEVVAKFPKSKDATHASSRLKKLKTAAKK